MVQDVTRNKDEKMQHGLRCNEDKYANRITMQHGPRCNVDQDAKDQDATRINMQ